MTTCNVFPIAVVWSALPPKMTSPPTTGADETNTSLLTLLECPVCFVSCTPPIRMCVNGHNVCNKCSTQIKSCPICGAPGQPSNRNLFAEEMSRKVRFPCSNANEGCTRYFNSTDITPHLLECDMRYRHTCYFALGCGEQGDILCGWSGTRRDLVGHVRGTHPAIYSTQECVEWKLEIPPKIPLFRTRLVAAHGQLFWVWLRYNTADSTVYLWANYVGNASNACKYECQFQSSSSDGRSKLSCSLQTLGAGVLSFSDVASPVMELNQKLIKKFMLENTFMFTARINKK